MEAETRDSNIDLVLSKLSKKTRAWVHLARDEELRRLPSPSRGLNQAMGGGFGHGRITTLWGNKSAGKSSLSLAAIGIAQNQGLTCAYLDSEKTFDPSWAESLGVNNSELFVAHTGSFAKANDTAVELIEAGIDVLVIDSITSMLASSFFEKDSDELKELDGTKQIGAAARDLGNMLKMLNYLNEKTVILVLSQMRNKFLQHGAMHQHTGGLALDHASSTIVKLSSSAREADQIQGEVVSGDTIFKRPIGREVNWEVQKNKIGPTFGAGTFTFYYAGERIGIDGFAELIDIATSYGIVKKGGAWYNVYDETIQGKIKTATYLAEHPEVVAKIEEELNEHLS